MRLLMSLVLSLLALTTVSADGMGYFKSAKAQQQANADRQNTIQVIDNQGVFLQSRSMTFTAATNGSAAVTAYDEVDIAAGTFPDDAGKGKVEIQIDNLNITQSGAGKKANINIQNFAFAWRPFSIVQYVEKAAIQNGFDANDTLCQQYQIRPSAANPFKFKWVNSTTVTAVNGTTVTLHTFQGATADGVFGVTIKATGAVGANTVTGAVTKAKAVWIDGRFVQPTSIKFDVAIDVNQTAFKLNKTAACANYQVAIVSWARSSQEVFARTTTQQTVNGTTTTSTTVTNLDRIQTGGAASPFGFFTWKPTANVTTVNPTTQVVGNTTINTTTTAQVVANVLATTLIKIQNDEDHDDKVVTKQAVHSFDALRPAIIKWDPEFGSDVTNPDMTDPNASSSSSTGSAGTDVPTSPSTTSSTASTTPSPSSTGSGRTPNTASTTSTSIVTMAFVALIALFA